MVTSSSDPKIKFLGLAFKAAHDLAPALSSPGFHYVRYTPSNSHLLLAAVCWELGGSYCWEHSDSQCPLIFTPCPAAPASAPACVYPGRGGGLEQHSVWQLALTGHLPRSSNGSTSCHLIISTASGLGSTISPFHR